MKYTNTKAKLLIALQPSQSVDTDKQYVELKAITELTNNYSTSKLDKTYYHNGGDQTSIITGRQISLNVTCDFDDSDDLHKYLRNLLFNQDFTKLNSQYMKLEIPKNSTQKDVITGKCCISFSNGIPNGSATDLQSLTFEIFPQDDPFTIKEENI